MPRRLALLQSDFPYHVTARCINKEWFSVPLSEVWQIMSEQLFFIHHAFNVEIISFVLMPNHFHLLVRTPQANSSQAMKWFMQETSRSIAYHGERINPIYGSRHYRSVVETIHYFLHAYKYVYANPLKAGLVTRVEGYRFSSLHGLLGQSHLGFPVAYDDTLFSDFEGTLKWLNQIPRQDDWLAVRKGLKHQRFKIAKSCQLPHKLETVLL